MSLPVIVLLFAVGLIVAALAGYLIAIAAILKHVNFTLGTIIVGIKSIAAQVEPVNPIMDELNKDLMGVKDALQELLARKAREAAGPAAPTPGGRGRR